MVFFIIIFFVILHVQSQECQFNIETYSPNGGWGQGYMRIFATADGVVNTNLLVMTLVSSQITSFTANVGERLLIYISRNLDNSVNHYYRYTLYKGDVEDTDILLEFDYSISSFFSLYNGNDYFPDGHSFIINEACEIEEEYWFCDGFSAISRKACNDAGYCVDENTCECDNDPEGESFITGDRCQFCDVSIVSPNGASCSEGTQSCKWSIHQSTQLTCNCYSAFAAGQNCDTCDKSYCANYETQTTCSFSEDNYNNVECFNCPNENITVGERCALNQCYSRDSDDALVCSGMGTCTSNGTCECTEPGITGDECDVCDVSGSLCHSTNTQSCEISEGSVICNCISGYGGSDCSSVMCNGIAGDDGCGGSVAGSCVAGSCVCNQYYNVSQEDCLVISDCEAVGLYCHPDNSLGTCQRERDGDVFINKCDCKNPYTGNECRTLDCANIGGIPEDISFYDDTNLKICFFVGEPVSTWWQARKYCKSFGQGFHLPTYTEENDYNVINNQIGLNFWNGLHATYDDGSSWSWEYNSDDPSNVIGTNPSPADLKTCSMNFNTLVLCDLSDESSTLMHTVCVVEMKEGEEEVFFNNYEYVDFYPYSVFGSCTSDTCPSNTENKIKTEKPCTYLIRLTENGYSKGTIYYYINEKLIMIEYYTSGITKDVFVNLFSGDQLKLKLDNDWTDYEDRLLSIYSYPSMEIVHGPSVIEESDIYNVVLIKSGEICDDELTPLTCDGRGINDRLICHGSGTCVSQDNCECKSGEGVSGKFCGECDDDHFCPPDLYDPDDYIGCVFNETLFYPEFFGCQCKQGYGGPHCKTPICDVNNYVGIVIGEYCYYFMDERGDYQWQEARDYCKNNFHPASDLPKFDHPDNRTTMLEFFGSSYQIDTWSSATRIFSENYETLEWIDGEEVDKTIWNTEFDSNTYSKMYMYFNQNDLEWDYYSNEKKFSCAVLIQEIDQDYSSNLRINQRLRYPEGEEDNKPLTECDFTKYPNCPNSMKICGPFDDQGNGYLPGEEGVCNDNGDCSYDNELGVYCECVDEYYTDLYCLERPKCGDEYFDSSKVCTSQRGTCVESLKRPGAYYCRCKTGYLGDYCEISTYESGLTISGLVTGIVFGSGALVIIAVAASIAIVIIGLILIKKTLDYGKDIEMLEISNESGEIVKIQKPSLLSVFMVGQVIFMIVMFSYWICRLLILIIYGVHLSEWMNFHSQYDGEQDLPQYEMLYELPAEFNAIGIGPNPGLAITAMVFDSFANIIMIVGVIALSIGVITGGKVLKGTNALNVHKTSSIIFSTGNIVSLVCFVVVVISWWVLHTTTSIYSIEMLFIDPEEILPDLQQVGVQSVDAFIYITFILGFLPNLFLTIFGVCILGAFTVPCIVKGFKESKNTQTIQLK